VGLGLRVRDAQCEFKAISRRAAQALLPLVRDTGFFFDTELLVLAQRGGWRVRELPVRWVDDPDSRVRLWRTIGEDGKANEQGATARVNEPARSPCDSTTQRTKQTKGVDLASFVGFVVRTVAREGLSPYNRTEFTGRASSTVGIWCKEDSWSS
jgi:hypothetical protein